MYSYAQCRPVQVRYILDNGFYDSVQAVKYDVLRTDNWGQTFGKRSTPTDVFLDTGILVNGVLNVTRRVCCTPQ